MSLLSTPTSSAGELSVTCLPCSASHSAANSAVSVSPNTVPWRKKRCARGRVRHHLVQGQGGAASDRARPGRVPGDPRRGRAGGRALLGRQPRLDGRRGGTGGPRAGRPELVQSGGTLLGRRRAGTPLARQAVPDPVRGRRKRATPADVTRELLAGAADAISIKTARTGFSDSLRVAHLAEGLEVPTVIGNQVDGQVGSACSLAVERRNAPPRGRRRSCPTSST